jgi:hypothetical protein
MLRMKKIHFGLIFLGIWLVIGCQKGPYPYITRQQAEKLASSIEPPITNVAFIYDNNIYYVADFTKPATQITTDGSAVKYVKVSHDHTKFAYVNGANNIEIIDAKGNVITTLTQYTHANSFDWSANDQTLYILESNTISYYGPSMNLPDFIDPGINGENTDIEIVSASVSTLGDLAYVADFFNYEIGYSSQLMIIPAGKSTPITYTNQSVDGIMDYVSFSSNLQDMVIGYTSSSTATTPSDYQYSMEEFTGLSNSPALSYGSGCTPVFKNSVNFIVSGTADSTNTSLVEPVALYTGPAPTQVNEGENYEHSLFLTKYSVSGNILYTDWK